MSRNGTRIDAVMGEIKSRIASRTYTPGARIPSVRAMARALQVSVSTVLEAYERLMAEGLLNSRPGSGFYVAGPVAPLVLTELAPRLDREVDPLWISRQSLETASDAMKPGCGWLPAAWMYEAGMRKALRTLARSDTVKLTDYASPLGHPPLRQFLSRRLAGTGIEAPADHIMLTESGTHAIDLICRFLLQPGDTVLVDDPCYFNFHALLKAHRVNIVSVPYTPAGPDIEAFGAALREHAPRLYITNAGIHNPTGASLSPVTAHRLLKLADSSSLVIVEDEIFADFEATPAPRLAAFDGLSRVIQIGSFSKTISASIRCGYIAARGEWIESLVDLKIATTFGGGRLGADIIYQAITHSGYRKHMEGVRQRLAQAMTTTVARLRALGIEPWITPQAGMYVWCQLPHGKDAATLAKACLSEGVVLAPGNAFSQAGTAGDFLRFNVAQCADDRIWEVLARALRG
ncbi:MULTISPECIES: PLP-dependent aminotransferase family protein [Pseudomonas]|jgi:DNA-binding transcriptional MocR family regulator|uniref:aminotransferase-like domain-containing protein n=1 Tax=Pseudomonas TaxID=286 RepID=UPI00053477D0|nr:MULTISPECIES: PLP-dependent aminotransferase family protein [Pseudomonas]EGB95485.2 GntR family transcriptional regulator [Pseudomonas sp. TJI-51]MBA6120024.1 PLP-dependent aminotransferase family protein [Pseudomonas juntendi]MBI6912420.1 PLP-dependent aminotransferase family protein [Pseudomonas juntendi]MCF3155026.1 PLP-dependent aminotransferase family protein [Pseudomonas juntendi]MCQ1988382.1 PLP-dependent aminotransferase family protein [Pseudomonas sp. Eb3]